MTARWGSTLTTYLFMYFLKGMLPPLMASATSTWLFSTLKENELRCITRWPYRQRRYAMCHSQLGPARAACRQRLSVLTLAMLACHRGLPVMISFLGSPWYRSTDQLILYRYSPVLLREVLDSIHLLSQFQVPTKWLIPYMLTRFKAPVTSLFAEQSMPSLKKWTFWFLSLNLMSLVPLLPSNLTSDVPFLPL